MFVVLEVEVPECCEQSSRDAKGKNTESDLLSLFMPTLKRSCQRCCWKFRVCCGQIDEVEDSQLDRFDSRVSTDVWPLLVLKLVTALGFIVISRSNLAPYVSHVTTAQLPKTKQKHWTMAVGLPQDHPSRTLPQGVMTWQWLALWHRPLTHPHGQSGAFPQNTCSQILNLTKCPFVFARPINACTGSSFAPIDLRHCSVKAIEGMSRNKQPHILQHLPEVTPVCRGRSLINDGWNWNWIESFIQIQLVGDSSMSRWVWFCDFYCHVPVNSPPPQPDTLLCPCPFTFAPSPPEATVVSISFLVYVGRVV